MGRVRRVVSEPPNGADFIALRELSIRDPNDDTKFVTVAEQGARCTNVPQASLGWLIERGWIVRAEETPTDAPAPEPETSEPTPGDLAPADE